MGSAADFPNNIFIEPPIVPSKVVPDLQQILESSIEQPKFKSQILPQRVDYKSAIDAYLATTDNTINSDIFSINHSMVDAAVRKAVSSDIDFLKEQYDRYKAGQQSYEDYRTAVTSTELDMADKDAYVRVAVDKYARSNTTASADKSVQDLKRFLKKNNAYMPNYSDAQYKALMVHDVVNWKANPNNPKLDYTLLDNPITTQSPGFNKLANAYRDYLLDMIASAPNDKSLVDAARKDMALLNAIHDRNSKKWLEQHSFYDKVQSVVGSKYNVIGQLFKWLDKNDKPFINIPLDKWIKSTGLP